MCRLALLLGLFLSCYSLVFSTNCKANDELLHIAAHVGSSYILQTVFYGINTEALKMNKPTAEALALIETLAIGLAYKLNEPASIENTMNSMFYNSVGSTLAIGTHIVFKF